ncbi:hypothetical protein [uncultured Maribacter sp.]|uniref:hypothetical protein n=1 Tax=uncultured Maribacter sp. TaxID=431308 RepID=UPI002614247B|nr:hypothetical protein [uncultured Maribacter sp.]
MEEISKTITELVYKKRNNIEIAQHLLKKGYSVEEIKSVFAEKKLIPFNINGLLGLLMILTGLFSILATKPTYLIFNEFEFTFSHRWDFNIFNELVLKPTISISIIILGANLLYKRVNVNKNVTYSLYILLSIFTIFITSYRTFTIPLVFSLVTLLLVWLIKLPLNLNLQKMEMVQIFPNINKKWYGSSIYIYILFGAFLILSSKAKTHPEAITSLHNYFTYAINSIFYGGLFTSVLISINFKKYKFLLHILGLVALLIALFSFFYSEFQNAIYGCLVFIISSIISIFNKKRLTL